MYMTRTGIYIHVQTRMYNDIFVCTWYKHTWYVQVLHSCTGTNMYVHGTDMSVPFCQILSRWSEFQMLGPFSQFSSAWQSSTVRPPRRGLPLPQFHSQVLTAYTLLPRLPYEGAESAQPMGKPEPLCLLNLCGIVGVELPARNKGTRGTLPTM